MIYDNNDKVGPDNLPRWIDNLKGNDPTIDSLIEYIIEQGKHSAPRHTGSAEEARARPPRRLLFAGQRATPGPRANQPRAPHAELGAGDGTVRDGQYQCAPDLPRCRHRSGWHYDPARRPARRRPGRGIVMGPAGFMAGPQADPSQDEVNEIMAGMEIVYANWVKHIEDSAPTCHFTKMQFHMGEDESWYECRHCGHTKEGSESNG